MAKITLTSGFQIIPEGHYTFKISSVEYKEAFGKLTISLLTKDNLKHTEKYSLLKADGSANEGAIGAFSYFAKTVLNDYNLSEIDPVELIGHFVEADIKHDIQDNKNKPGQTVTFVHVSNLEPSNGWEDSKDNKPDLKSILG